MADAVPTPPQNLDAEESVLGAMLLSPRAVEAVSEILGAADFYRGSHARIYLAALELYQQGQPVDAITVADLLDEKGELEDVGGKRRIHELAALVPATSNAAHYAKIVREMATLRGLTVVGEQIQRLGWDRPGEAPDLVDEAQRLVFALSQERERGDFVPVSEPLDHAYQLLQERAESGKAIVGVPTGYVDLDRLTLGLHPGTLVLIAGRPSLGKSAFALGIVANAAIRQGRPVGLFSLEMSKLEVTQRLVSMEARVESRKVQNGQLDGDEWRRVHTAAQLIHDAPLWINDNAAVTLHDLRGKARQLKLQHPDLAFIVLDYLQLMTSGGTFESRVQEVSQISRALKILAREMALPVVALSQLSRGPETRHDARPMLSDLRESGALEQDADVVMFIYRDEVYHDDSEQKGIAEIIVSKHRNGPTGTVKLQFTGRYSMFADLHIPS